MRTRVILPFCKRLFLEIRRNFTLLSLSLPSLPFPLRPSTGLLSLSRTPFDAPLSLRLFIARHALSAVWIFGTSQARSR